MSSLLLCKDFMLRWIRLLCFIAYTSCYVGYVLSTLLHTLHVTLDRSSLLQGTHFMLRWICLAHFAAHTLHVTLDMSCLLCCTHFMLRWVRLLCFIAHTSCYVGYVLPTSVHTHFMLRWIRLLCYFAHTSCYVGYVGYVVSASLHALDVTLDTSSLRRYAHFILRWICWIRLLCFVAPTHFMLHWIHLVYFAHTSCYVGYVFSASLHTLHVTLGMSCLFRACPHWDNR